MGLPLMDSRLKMSLTSTQRTATSKNTSGRRWFCPLWEWQEQEILSSMVIFAYQVQGKTNKKPAEGHENNRCARGCTSPVLGGN